MATDRTTLVRGPGYLTVGSATTPSTTTNLIQFGDDFAAIFEQKTDDLIVSTQGAIDKTRTDAAVRMSGTPLVFSPTQTSIMTLLFAQFGQLPVIGASLCGSTDTPVIYMPNANDALAVYNVCCPKPPNLTLDINKAMIDKLELVGLIRNNFDLETANSYFRQVTGLSYSPPVLLQSGDLIGRQRYLWNWAAGNSATGNSTFTNFQGQKGATVSFEADWQPVVVQGRTIDYTLGPKGLRAMVKMIPVGPSALDITTVQQFQGSGASHGSRLSANTAMGNLIGTGQKGGTITILNAVLETAGFVFGGVPLRVGEVGFVGTFNMTASPSTGGITLAA